jgi:purine-cytosine permease-like protein
MATDTVLIPEEYGVERHGIERISPHTRTHVRIRDNFTMWLSANLVISTVALGALAKVVFGLGFWDSLAVIIIFNAPGGQLVAALICGSTATGTCSVHVAGIALSGIVLRGLSILVIAILTTLVSIYGYR